MLLLLRHHGKPNDEQGVSFHTVDTHRATLSPSLRSLKWQTDWPETSNLIQPQIRKVRNTRWAGKRPMTSSQRATETPPLDAGGHWHNVSSRRGQTAAVILSDPTGRPKPAWEQPTVTRRNKKNLFGLIENEISNYSVTRRNVILGPCVTHKTILSDPTNVSFTIRHVCISNLFIKGMFVDHQS